MKIFFQNITTSLNNFSKSLDRKSIFVDKPWALIDSDLEMQKLIFKKNKELILSKDGQVVMGKWDYFPEAKSLLIDRGQDKILLNEGFIDEGVMILKKDGTNNEFFVLANENVVPDLDAYSYLQKLRYRKLNIITRTLSNGKALEVLRGKFSDIDPRIGDHVSFDADNVSDGEYKVEKSIIKYIIKESTILTIIHEVIYWTKNGPLIMIEQHDQHSYGVWDKVWIDGKPAGDGKYRIMGGMNIVVKNGRIKVRTLF